MTPVDELTPEQFEVLLATKLADGLQRWSDTLLAATNWCRTNLEPSRTKTLCPYGTKHVFGWDCGDKYIREIDFRAALTKAGFTFAPDGRVKARYTADAKRRMKRELKIDGVF